MEGIEADDRVRAGAADHVGDPGGTVGADAGGPRHVLDHHPVLRAAHAPDLRLHVGAERAEIERPPTPASTRPVVARAAASALPIAGAATPAGEPTRAPDRTRSRFSRAR